MASRKSPFFDTATTLGKLVAFFGVSALCGVLAAGLMVPVAAAAGTAASGSLQFFDQLPAELERGALAQPSKIYANDGALIATLYEENRQPVTLDQVSENMVDAILAIEDDRFYEHGGVDLQGIASALVSNATSDTSRGASTITMQYVNNVIIDTARQNGEEYVLSGNKTVGDKLREIKLAIAVEKELSKEEILEGYFNIVPFSGTTYGVQAAARYFYNVDAKDLNVQQSAMLAGLVNGPTYYSPEAYPERAVERRNLVLGAMLDKGRIDQAEYDAAVASELGITPTPVPSNCVGAAQAPYFCDYVQALIENDENFGATREERRKLLLRGGLTINTTLNSNIQAAAQEAINETANPDTTDGEIGHAMVSVEPGTGNILMMAQNTRFNPDTTVPGNSVQNFNVDVNQNGDPNKPLNGLGGFQPGSTYKPFTVAAWLDAGKTLNTSLDGRKRTYPAGHTWNASCLPGGRYVTPEAWTPINYGDTNYKTTTVLDGLANSLNTITLAEINQLDLCSFQQLAFQAGIHNGKGQDGERQMLSVDPPSTFGGGGDASPLSMATGFATLAAEGLKCEPRALTSVTAADGREFPVPEQQCEQVMKKEVAQGVNYATQRVMTNGSGYNLQIGVPVGGKTGTNDERSQTWFMGYTTGMSTASWIGNWKANNTTMSDKLIGGRVYPEIDGSLIAGPSWKNFMQRIPGQYEANAFTNPPGSVIGQVAQPRPAPNNNNDNNNGGGGNNNNNGGGNNGGGGNNNGGGNGGGGNNGGGDGGDD
ncbi:Penicillin-binding protein 1F [Arthrobacter saudimassiliensis]|uniref:Penicillin-binding protein 1F n=1 Tax=Arthrobacter saudimassiliensis TaxID=1461584 RepID=A0A078MUI1_9MICC|nr:Penicillin-binding protein 1F [Arthrobacter saudimassiliensis]